MASGKPTVKRSAANFNDAAPALQDSVLNSQTAAANNSLPPVFAYFHTSPSSLVQLDLCSMTKAPSPSLPTRTCSGNCSASGGSNAIAFGAVAATVSTSTSSSLGGASSTSSSTADDLEPDRYNPSPLGSGNGLRVQTNAAAFAWPQPRKNSFVNGLSPGRPQGVARKSSSSSLKAASRTPSVKAAIANSMGTASAASSTYSSPTISAMSDVTPLPSPLLSTDSPGPWKMLAAATAAARRPSRDGLLPVPTMQDSVLVSTTGESISAALAIQSKRQAYAALAAGQVETKPQAGSQPLDRQSHPRNRSTSEHTPPPVSILQTHTTVSGARGENATAESSAQPPMRREPNLSETRGIVPTSPIGRPPTPPPSESELSTQKETLQAKPKNVFEARGRDDQKLRRWKAVKYLGQGTFSKVMLATSQAHPIDEFNMVSDSKAQDGMITPTLESQLDRKALVAVKICEHGPRGGASEERIEMSLKRELEILRSFQHPSLVHLKAWNIEPSRALLVFSYCPGGDLFDIASACRQVLTPTLLRRIFSELVGAVRYLHGLQIVHRDIKLENVLVNLTPNELADGSVNWLEYPYSIVTLADLGLARRIAHEEKLNTRCGSEDYAAPEVILGQPYDGRATDAWSLGVLLYALIESRLPFDPDPAMVDSHRLRSRTSHRIARVEWQWYKYGGDDGDHDANEAKFAQDNLLGAMQITEGLLKRARSRFTIDQVAQHEWIKGGIQVEGGLQFRQEDEGEEVC